jgi:hypothetical protein
MGQLALTLQGMKAQCSRGAGGCSARAGTPAGCRYAIQPVAATAVLSKVLQIR